MGINSRFLNLDTDVTLSSNSDEIIPSQKAIKTYIDTKSAGSLTGSNATLTLKSISGSTLNTVTVNNVAVATKATQDGNGATIATTYIPRSFNGNVAGDAVAKAPEVYGTSSKPVGLFRNFNLLHAVENKFFGADKGVKTGTAATITCNYTVTNMFNGSYDGYNTSINPSTDFSSTPFVFEMKCPTSFEVTDVCNLYLAGHRQTYQMNVTAYKLEVAYAYSSANGYSWGAIIDYSGSAINILNKHYGLYYAEHGGANSYHSVYGIRLTISGATSTVFAMSEIMLLSSRGTEKVTNALNTINTYDGGTVRGNITIPTANGSFVGNLDGTATKATKDGDGNTISSSYLKLSGGTMTGAIKFASSSLSQNQTPQYYLAMDAFASGGEVKWTSVANARSGKDGDGNTISSTYLKLSGGTLTGPLSIDKENTATLLTLGDGTVQKQLRVGNITLVGFAGTTGFTIATKGSENGDRILMLPSSGRITKIYDNVQVDTLWSNQKGAANGVASLDANTKVPVAQIPDLSSTYATKTEVNEKVEYAMVIKEW